MSTKTTIALAVAAGFLGGVASQRILPTPVRAQEQASVPQEIRAHKFVIVDDAGVDRGVFGFPNNVDGGVFGFINKGLSPDIELMDSKGHTWTPRYMGSSHVFLPDTTCQTCPRKPAKKDSTPSPDGTTPK
jgi:hypothetical protein